MNTVDLRILDLTLKTIENPIMKNISFSIVYMSTLEQ